MFKNNLKIAFRSLFRRKGYALVNSFGLAIGITSCILIALYVHYEFSYDQSFQNGERIFRMFEERKTIGDTEVKNRVPYSFVGVLPSDYPEVESATAIAGPFASQGVSVVKENGERVSFLEENVLLADSNFFAVFSFHLLSGNRNDALKNPNSVVLSESAALRYFGTTDVLGERIQIARRNSTITGVCEDPPVNSHFKFSYIVSSTSVRWFSQEHFNLRGALCYVKLRPESSPRLLEEKFPKMVDTYMAGEIERINKVSWEKYKAEGNGFSYYLKPISEIHLDPDVDGGMKAGGNLRTLRILIAIAVLVFIIACINFMNLATARSMERAKEVGVRKVMGSFQAQLILQFLTESFLISFLSLILALGLTLMSLPFFNNLSGSALVLEFNGFTSLAFVGSAFFISVVAGLYPAFVLSSFRPMKVLRGSFTTSRKGKRLKDVLVVFQFWIAIILISSTWILHQQIEFMSEKDLGYDPEELLVIEGTFHRDANFTRPYLDEVKKISGVKSVAGTLWMPGFQGVWRDEYRTQESAEVLTISRGAVGDNLMNVAGLQLMEGKFFEPTANDSLFVVLNESAVKLLGLADPVGKKLTMLDHDDGQLIEIPFTIKGVVEDFNYGTLHNEVEPLVLQSNEKFLGRMSSIVVKLERESMKSTLEQLEVHWKELIPDRPFVFQFVDDALQASYQREEKLGTILSLFSGLSIVISILGLLAMSTYSSELRKKEIGVRKVLGASVADLLLLLSKDFTKVIAFSILLATPVSWYAMDQWLSDFAYRVDLQLWVFFATGLFTMVLTWLVVSSQTIRVATSNPVEALKDE